MNLRVGLWGLVFFGALLMMALGHDLRVAVAALVMACASAVGAAMEWRSA